MCAHSLAAVAPLPAAARPLRLIACGAAAGLLALAGFGTAHALIITPIWLRLLPGLVLVLPAGIALAWAFDAWNSTTKRQTLFSGVQFGAVMFVTLLPATAVDTSLRLSGARRGDAWQTALSVALTLMAGSIAGRALARERRAIAAFAAAALALMLASAGPLPVAQSPKGLWLSLAIAPICLVAGALIAALHRTFIRKPL